MFTLCFAGDEVNDLHVNIKSRFCVICHLTVSECPADGSIKLVNNTMAEHKQTNKQICGFDGFEAHLQSNKNILTKKLVTISIDC